MVHVQEIAGKSYNANLKNKRLLFVKNTEKNTPVHAIRRKQIMIKYAKWIWTSDKERENEYSEFVEKFSVSNGEKVVLNISCDGVYSVYINGELAAFSACADYPYYKFYDEIDISKFCKKENEIKIVVCHLGKDSQTYIKDSAGVIFEITANEKTVAKSDKNTLSRVMNEYKNGYDKMITLQLGQSFLYDNTVVKSGYSESVVIDKTYDLHKRNIKGLKLCDRLPINIFEKENSVIIDMGKEVAGFLDMDIESPESQKLLIAYGEHLEDGIVRRIIGIRDFSVEFVAKKGDNKYLNALRRLGGRYLQIYSDYPVKINYIGIRPVEYPVKAKKAEFFDELMQRIYDTSVYTLKCCMHEHYEDCPWREQALYTMDSRNQMLFGYYAFEDGNKEYVRHNLILIAKGLREDGLLSLCFPTGIDIPIPFFSLVYLIQVYEYIRYTKDESIMEEVGEAAKKIFLTFAGKVEENGLIPTFPYPCWNFYEWAEESNNEWQITRTKDDKDVKSYDLILNCMFVYCAGYYEKLFGEKYSVEKTKKAIKETFYNGKYYKLSNITEKSSQLGNSLAILIGLGDEELAERIISDKEMIAATLSMRAFLYDALLTLGDKYKGYILNDIKEKYKKMLDAGATTFWETEKGAADFDGAGSLCHGWSALPVYYFNILN